GRDLYTCGMNRFACIPLLFALAACGPADQGLDEASGAVRGSRDFVLQVAPDRQLAAAGTQAAFTVSAQGKRGFSGAVALSATGLPAGAAASFAGTLSAGGSVMLSVSTSTSTPQGTYAITVIGEAGSKRHTAGPPLTVTT